MGCIHLKKAKADSRYRQTIHPIAPTANNITNHNAARSPQSILHLREDTLSQLLTSANIRPGGRYLVVDDTGGLVTAAMMERMGCEGRIMTFTENDSPPGWGVLGVMNFSERELDCVRWLNWMEADEAYQRRMSTILLLVSFTDAQHLHLLRTTCLRWQ